MTALEAPRRLLLGRARHRLMLAGAALAWWPLAVLPVVVVLSFMGELLILAGLVLMVAAVERVRPGWSLGKVRTAYWRSRWWFDARSAGLVAIADPSINAVHERGGSHAVGIEVAPRLVRLRCNPHGRSYRIRLLPGQLLDDLDRAVPALAERWSGQVTVHPYGRRARTVVLEVVTSDAVASTVAHPRRRG